MRTIYKITRSFLQSLFALTSGLKIEGVDNIPKIGAVIFASNHQSYFDPPIIGCSCSREIIYAAKKELFDIPVFSSLIKYFNAIPVKRSGFDKSFIVNLGKTLKSGKCILIFPEGTRYTDGKIRSPKLGAAMLAFKNKVPIVPVCITGSASFGSQIYKRKLRVRFGAPIYSDRLDLADADTKTKYRLIADQVMRKIAEIGSLEMADWNSREPAKATVKQIDS